MAGYKESPNNGLDSGMNDTVKTTGIDNTAIKDDMLEEYGVWVKVEPEIIEDAEQEKEVNELRDFDDTGAEVSDTEIDEASDDLEDISFNLPEEENIEPSDFEEISEEELEGINSLSLGDTEEDTDTIISGEDSDTDISSSETLVSEDDIDLEALEEEVVEDMTAEEFLNSDETGSGESFDMSLDKDTGVEDSDLNEEAMELIDADLDLSDEILELGEENLDMGDESMELDDTDLDISDEPLEIDETDLDISDESMELDDTDLDISDEPLEMDEEDIDISDESLELEDMDLDMSDESLELGDEDVDKSDESMELEDEDIDISDESLDLDDEDIDISDESLDLGDEDVDISDESLDLEDEDIDLGEEPLDLDDEDIDISDESLDLGDEDIDISDESLDLEDEGLDLGEEPLDLGETEDDSIAIIDESIEELDLSDIDELDNEEDKLGEIESPDEEDSAEDITDISDEEGELDDISIEDFEELDTIENLEAPELDSGLEDINLDNIDEEIESIVEKDLLELEEKGQSIDEDINFEDSIPDEEIEVPLSDELPKEDQFDDLKTYESKLKDIAPKKTEIDQLQSTSILSKIEKELLSIKDELSQLKKELIEIKKPTGKKSGQEIIISSPDTTDFFDQEEDETIALTGNELNNILNTADITEEVAEESVVTEKDEEDFTFPIDENDETVQITETTGPGDKSSKSWEDSPIVEKIELEEAGETESWNESPEKSFENKIDDMIEHVEDSEIEIQKVDTEKELIIEENPEEVPGKESTSIDDTQTEDKDELTIDESIELEIPEEEIIDTEVTELDENIKEDIDFEDDDFDLDAFDSDEALSELDLDLSDETSSDTEMIIPASDETIIDETEIKDEGFDDSDIENFVPETEGTIELTEEVTEIPYEEESDIEFEAIDTKSSEEDSDEIIEEFIPEEDLELTLPEEKGVDEEIELDKSEDFETTDAIEEEFDIADEADVDSMTITDLDSEEIEDVELTDFDVDFSITDTDKDESPLETSEDDIEIIADEDSLEDSTEDFIIEEATSMDKDEYQEEIEDTIILDEEDNETVLEIPGDEELSIESFDSSMDKEDKTTESGNGKNMNLIPDNLKNELISVLSYMDKLLESLPDDKIEEFARSDYFATYKKLFDELGLTT